MPFWSGWKWILGKMHDFHGNIRLFIFWNLNEILVHLKCNFLSFSLLNRLYYRINQSVYYEFNQTLIKFYGRQIMLHSFGYQKCAENIHVQRSISVAANRITGTNFSWILGLDFEFQSCLPIPNAQIKQTFMHFFCSRMASICPPYSAITFLNNQIEIVSSAPPDGDH